MCPSVRRDSRSDVADRTVDRPVKFGLVCRRSKSRGKQQTQRQARTQTRGQASLIDGDGQGKDALCSFSMLVRSQDGKGRDGLSVKYGLARVARDRQGGRMVVGRGL